MVVGKQNSVGRHRLIFKSEYKNESVLTKKYLLKIARCSKHEVAAPQKEG
jgi:hypothetical protein